MAETDLFRLTLPVPESAVPLIRLGTTVTVHVHALNRDFEGKVARFADAVDQETRTMHTEVDVQNRTAASCRACMRRSSLTLAKKEDALAVPIQAVSRNGSQATVLVVNSQDRDRRARSATRDGRGRSGGNCSPASDQMRSRSDWLAQ